MNNHVNTLTELTVGDKVLCKKYPKKDSYGMFQINKTYTVTLLDIDDMSAWITYGADLNNNGRWFSLEKNDDYDGGFLPFFEHFYSKKEMRKFMISETKSLSGLNVGDKVLCKKNHNNDDAFKIDELYTINIFDNDDKSVWVTYGINTNTEGRWFALFENEDINYNRFPFFYDHFYTPREIRKMKLEKIK